MKYRFKTLEEMKDQYSSHPETDWVRLYISHIGGRYAPDEVVSEIKEINYAVICIDGYSISVHIDMITRSPLPGKIANRFFRRYIPLYRSENSMGNHIWKLEDESTGR